MSHTDLQAVQKQWLLNCLQANKHSTFGKQYNFTGISSVQDYQQQLPLHYYQDLKPWIDVLAQGQQSVLFDSPVIAFERTSGSSDASKLIPYSKQSLQDFQNAILPWLKSITEHYQLQQGFVYWALSPATRTQEYSASGIAIGLADEKYLGDNIHSVFTLQPAVPVWVGMIEDVQQWQLYSLYWLIRRKQLALISVWSPTFFIVLLQAIDRHFPRLTTLLQEGGQYHEHYLPADKEAYQRLQYYSQKKDRQLLWPNLKLVSCWADASSASYYAQLKKMLGHAHFQAKGLLLTEGIVTIPDKDGQMLLAAQSGFFEFLNNEQLLLAHELIVSHCYEVVITTSGGLYRYRTQDQVVCEGYKNGLPILRFIGRTGIHSDLVGEKLTEAFVTSCLSPLAGFQMLLPCPKKNPYYQLLLEKMAYTACSEVVEQVEQLLCNNPHYAYARKMGQLGKLQIQTMQQPLEKYLQVMINRGLRMGDIKIPALSLDPDLLNQMREIHS